MSSPDAAGLQNPPKRHYPVLPSERVQTDKHAHIVSPGLPQSAEGSADEGMSSHPSTNESNSRMGREIQSQHETEKNTEQGHASAFPPPFDEIRLLKDRLVYLEEQANQQWKATIENAPPKDSNSGRETNSSDSDDDEVLRKHILKAPFSSQRVEMVEQLAEKRADERKAYGQGPNKAGVGLATSTMYHVQQSGDLFRGSELDAVIRNKGWVDTYGQTFPGSSHEQESVLRQREKPLPHRGVRPPAAMRPFYQAPLRKEVSLPEAPLRKSDWQKFNLEPLKLSRKLGPPTRWDESDLEEWSSDTSTRSQDFKYFRSRLRGDFEWELDRLNAQVLRYRKHKDKKSRKLATEARKDNERRDEELGAYDQHNELIAKLELDAKAAGQDEHGIRQLNPVGWSIFRLSRAMPLQYSFVIDVLVEEPRLSSDRKPWGQLNQEMKDKKVHKRNTNFRTTAAKIVNIKDDAAQTLRQSAPWTEQDPLPERIRINSKQILGILSSIHGSTLCLDEDLPSSVVVLRPFRILNAYGKEIRETCSRLRDDVAMGSEQPTSGGDQNQNQQVKSNIAQDAGAAEKSSSVSDKTTTVGGMEETTSQEDRRLQLEHLGYLQRFMDEYIGRRLAYLNSVYCSKIYFSDVWHLFQPGTTVISTEGKQAYRVISLKSKRHKGADRWAAFWARKREKDSRKSDSSEDETDDTRADITITCVFIHFDGKVVGPVIQTFQINKWDGEKEVTYLDIYPIRFHVLKRLDKRSLTATAQSPSGLPEQELRDGVQVLRQKMIDRGRVFLDVAAVKQMYYSGLAVDTRDEVESQVMVDFEEALGHDERNHWIPTIQRLVGTDWNSKTDESDKVCTAECCWQENVHDDAYVESNNTEKFVDDMMAEIKDTPDKLPSAIIFPRTLEETKTESNALTDDELMIMSYSVFGFVLRDRTWAKLDLDCMSAVRSPGSVTEQTDDDLEEGGQGAFGQLVLPPGHKKMVLSLISQHFRNKESQETNDKQVDIVRGKGKGLIILLHGAPGVGKTTTAEGVAETFGQPLFQITCGDLGSNPKDVETALQTNFALANRWGCILLLDEADVFLAERRREDFNRNGLVAVFLRVLEYYAGILFLTTNRIGDFDEAFASRIHMSLHYPALDEVSTAKVFRLNLGLIKARLQERVKIEEDEIITAAQKHWRQHKDARWNGRQIRNACQTALALAEFDAQPKGKKYDIKEKSTAKVHLKLSHLEIVSNAYLEFTDYLKAVHGTDADGRAKESGLRALDTLVEALKVHKGEGRTSRHRSSSRGHGQTGRDTPFQGFRLRSGSGDQRPTPGMAPSPSPETAGQHAPPGRQGMYPPQQLPHDPSSAMPQRMQYNQSAYTGSQPFMGDMRTGMNPPSQHVQQGTYLQPPQGYSSVGHGGRGQYQASDQYIHGSQPLQGHTVSYPSPPTSAVSGGPSSGGPSLGRFGDDQSRQSHRGGQGPYDDSEQM